MEKISPIRAETNIPFKLSYRQSKWVNIRTPINAGLAAEAFFFLLLLISLPPHASCIIPVIGPGSFSFSAFYTFYYSMSFDRLP